MAISVTPNLTDISLCEAVTGWSAGAVNSDFALQGTYCLGAQAKATTSSLYTYTFGSPVNMTGKHIYVWMMITGVADTKANGGYRIYVETDASNYGYWYVGGKDTHPGGWGCFVIDPANTSRSSGAGTVNVSSIAKIGVQFKTLSTITGTNPNIFWDACRYGTGLSVTSGATDAIDYEDIFAIDDNSTYKYGVITKGAGGIYVQNGLLTLGDASSTGSVDFVETDKIVVFPDNAFVSTTFYGITVQGNSTGTTNFTLGAKSGTSGISGCTFKAMGTRQFSIDCSDTDNDKVLLYGTTFSNHGIITLLPTAANREVLNCNFSSGAKITPNTCIMENCNFVTSAADTISISSTSFAVKNSSFINPGSHAVEITAAGDYDFDNLSFSGTNGTSTYDIENTTAGAVVVNALNGSNPVYYENTGGGTVTIVASPVTTTVTVKTVAGAAIENARVLLVAAAGGLLPYDATVTIVNSSTTATVTHTAHGMATNDKVQISGASLNENNGVFTITKISDNSYSYTMASAPGSSPTGTIKATYAALFGLSNSSGVVTNVKGIFFRPTHYGQGAKGDGKPIL